MPEYHSNPPYAPCNSPPEWLSDSRDTELVAEKEKLVVRIPWGEDYNGKSVVDLKSLKIQIQ